MKKLLMDRCVDPKLPHVDENSQYLSSYSASRLVCYFPSTADGRSCRLDYVHKET